MMSPLRNARKLWGSLVAGAVALGTGTAAQAATCSVPSASYATIQSAANDATCSLIQVAAGTYTEQVTLNFAGGVTLQGAGEGRTIIMSPAVRQPSTLPTTFYPNYTYIVQVAPTTIANISGLTIDGGSNSYCGEPLFGVRFNNATGSLTNVVVQNVISPGAALGCQNTIAVAGTAETVLSGLTVNNSVVRNFQKVGILINGPTAGGSITNTIVRGVGPQPYTAQDGIEFARGAFGQAVANIISNVQYTGDACLGMASGIINYQAGETALTSNVFQNVDQGIYLEQSTGPQTVSDNRVFSGSAGLISDSNAAGVVRLSVNGVTALTTNPITNAATCFTGNGNGITVINETGSVVIGNEVSSVPAYALALGPSTGSLDVEQNHAIHSGTADIQDQDSGNSVTLNACNTSLPAGLCTTAP